MKQSMRSLQEPRRVSNGVIIAAMLLSLCVASIVKAKYCSTPFDKTADKSISKRAKESSSEFRPLQRTEEQSL
ncbi:hypothetical protein ABZP36_018442 [Zizania latifolia]